jgi:hypothetical protein
LNEYINIVSAQTYVDDAIPPYIKSAVDTEAQRLIEKINLIKDNSSFGGSSEPKAESSQGALERNSIDGIEDILIAPFEFGSLRVGSIIDAQDYLEQWYLAIVIEDLTVTPSNQKRKIHFLPFQKNSKRDEVFSASDSTNKVAPVFSNSE